MTNQLPNIPHLDELTGIGGPFRREGVVKDLRSLQDRELQHNKIAPSLKEAVRLAGLKNGMTISFHHHFRNGDYVVNSVLKELARLGYRDLVLAASSLASCHAPLIEHIKSGVIRRIETSGLRGDLARAVSHGLMEVPVVFRSHGGRAYAVETGKLPIDVAFLGAPSCDPYGNANGYTRDQEGGLMCGSMGYAKCDASFAKKTIVITNNIVPYPNVPFALPEGDVDYIVQLPEIGDPQGIMTGSTRETKNPKELLMAETVVEVIQASRRLQDGFSIQMGTGGAALAVSRFLGERMRAMSIQASFALGGITGSIVDLHEAGLIKKILDVQSFDLRAAESLKNNRLHHQISAAYYASPGNVGTAVNQLDVAVLSALEVDVNYNVNLLTGSDGTIRGAIGGHPDVAFGASVTIVVCPLTRGRIPCVVDQVATLVTPGNTVDVIVTEMGVAVNPRRQDLVGLISRGGLPVCTIEELRDKAKRIVGNPKPVRYTDKVVGVVTYRDGSVIDLIYQVAE